MRHGAVCCAGPAPTVSYRVAPSLTRGLGGVPVVGRSYEFGRWLFHERLQAMFKDPRSDVVLPADIQKDPVGYEAPKKKKKKKKKKKDKHKRQPPSPLKAPTKPPSSSKKQNTKESKKDSAAAAQRAASKAAAKPTVAPPGTSKGAQEQLERAKQKRLAIAEQLRGSTARDAAPSADADDADVAL